VPDALSLWTDNGRAGLGPVAAVQSHGKKRLYEKTTTGGAPTDDFPLTV
jgi:hypothetical protein